MSSKQESSKSGKKKSMRFEHDSNAFDDLEPEEYAAGSFHAGPIILQNDKEFVLRTIAEIERAGLGIVHHGSDRIERLYLISGGVYRLDESSVTRVW